MTKSRIGIWLIAALAAGHAVPSVIGALALDDVTLYFRVVGLAIGLLLLAGAGLLILERPAGVALVWASACIYALVMIVPAIQRHGTGAFSALMGAFYVSLSIRLGLAVAAHMIVGRRRS